MLVYRYLCEEEFQNIVNLRLDEIGTVYYGKKVSNSFRYKKDEKYLHFYKDKKNMNEMRLLRLRDGKEYYYCTFDIPVSVLAHGIGTGYYCSRRGDRDYEHIREFIVMAKKFNPKWLIDAEFDQDKHRRIEADRERGYQLEVW